MVHPCIVPGCKNKAKDGIYRFPRDTELRRSWLKSINCDNKWNPDDASQIVAAESYRICGLHFKPSDFERDLKGELLGIPSKRKNLLPGAIPTGEKQERQKLPTGPKQRVRKLLPANFVYKGGRMYDESLADFAFDAYAIDDVTLSRKVSAITKIHQKRSNKASNRTIDSDGSIYIKRYSGKNSRNVGEIISLGSNLNHVFLDSAANQSSIQQFMLDKAEILAKLKKEAEENVLKEKVMSSMNHFAGTISETQGDVSDNSKIRRLPPQQCVILKPLLKEFPTKKLKEGSENFELTPPPPIIIPGDPKKSMKLLQDKKGQEIIQKEMKKHQTNRLKLVIDSQTDDQYNGTINADRANENTTAIILTSLANLNDDDGNNEKQNSSFPGAKPKNEKVENEHRTSECGRDRYRSLPPLRIKQDSNQAFVKDIDLQTKSILKRKYTSDMPDLLPIKIRRTLPKGSIHKIQPGQSKKCTVLDLLFDRQDPSEELDDPAETITPPEPVPDDTRLPIIVFKNKAVASKAIKSAESSGVQSRNDMDNEGADSITYAIFDPSGLKSELDNYKEEVKQLRKANYALKIKNQTLRNEKTKLSKKIEVREKSMETRRKKSKKDLDTISKLRVELSKLRQLRNKMRRREYNRKAKHEKVLERRKKRREFIQQQIELGNMDKSSLSLVYSRKKLPYERKQRHTSNTTNEGQTTIYSNTSYFSNTKSFSDHQSVMTATMLPTPTVEYIIEHDGRHIDATQTIEETVVEVGGHYDTVTVGEEVTDAETATAVAGICNLSHDIHQTQPTAVITASSSSDNITYVTVPHEHQYITMPSHSLPANPIPVVPLQNSLQQRSTDGAIIHTSAPTSTHAATGEYSQEHLDFIVKAVDEFESGNSQHLVSTVNTSRPATSSGMTVIRPLPVAMQRRHATFVVLAPSSSASVQTSALRNNQTSAS